MFLPWELICCPLMLFNFIEKVVLLERESHLREHLLYFDPSPLLLNCWGSLPMPDWSIFISLLEKILVTYSLIYPFLDFLFVASPIATLLLLFVCHLGWWFWLAVIAFWLMTDTEGRIRWWVKMLFLLELHSQFSLLFVQVTPGEKFERICLWVRIVFFINFIRWLKTLHFPNYIVLSWFSSCGYVLFLWFTFLVACLCDTGLGLWWSGLICNPILGQFSEEKSFPLLDVAGQVFGRNAKLSIFGIIF